VRVGCRGDSIDLPAGSRHLQAEKEVAEGSITLQLDEGAVPPENLQAMIAVGDQDKQIKQYYGKREEMR
jgi:hypothetical protein